MLRQALRAARTAWSLRPPLEMRVPLTSISNSRATWYAISFSWGKVVQFVMVGLPQRERSGEAHNDERTTIHSQRERSELESFSPNLASEVTGRRPGASCPTPKTKTKT